MTQQFPVPAAPVADDLFLTPRVIDAGAFGKYSAALRELIESSQATGQQLTAERERTEKILDRAREISGSIPAAAASSSQIKEARSSQTDTVSAARIGRLEVTVAELAGRLEQAEASAQEAKSIANANQDSFNQSTLDGSELTPEFDEALARAEAAESRLRQLIGKAENAGDELSEKMSDVIVKAANSGTELTAMIMMLAEQVEKAEAVQGIEELSTESVRHLGELIERGQAMTTAANERLEQLEAMNIRADASGEALLRASRASTDGAVTAESIAMRLNALISRAEAFDAAQAQASHAADQADSLRAGERLAIGTPAAAPIIHTPTITPSIAHTEPTINDHAEINRPVGSRGADLRSFEERAAAEGEPTAAPRPTSPQPFSARPFPPTPISPSLGSKPRLQRPARPIDAEDFGQPSDPTSNRHDDGFGPRL